MARYRHWTNSAQAGETVFITTTCLDFNHAFSRPEMKSRMAARIASDHLFYRARLYGFVVMSHHVHLLTGLPPDKDVSWFVQRLKSNSAKELGPLLTKEELAGFALQEGLDGRQFWQRSFRSVVVSDHDMFNQKLEYIHNNPVRASLVERPEDYLWSSASFLLAVETEAEMVAGIAGQVLDRFDGA